MQSVFLLCTNAVLWQRATEQAPVAVHCFLSRTWYVLVKLDPCPRAVARFCQPASRGVEQETSKTKKCVSSVVFVVVVVDDYCEYVQPSTAHVWDQGVRMKK